MQETASRLRDLDSQTAALKVPPHSLDAEQSVLGGLLLDNSAWDQIADRVSQEDFYQRSNALIFAAIRGLIEAGSPCDLVTLSQWLEKRNQLDDAGGLIYLTELVESTPSAANVRAYAAIVREKSVLRHLIRVGGQIADAAFNTEGRETRELLDHVEQLVFQIADGENRGRGGFAGMSDVLTRVIERIDELHQSGSALTGVSSGFTDLDEKTAGLQRSDLIIVAGRPSMGKTSFAMKLAENVALAEKRPVAVFSMEMPAEQLVMRMISSLGRINQSKIRTGRLTDDDWPRFTSTTALLRDSALFIDDSPALTPTDLRARARRLKRENGDLGLIVVDYLQLMQVPGTKENRTNEISEISRSLKALAKELDCPVVALSQLNRSLEQRTDKRPVMSDLRESGAIEQDADVILFVYRDEVYHDDSPHKGMAEIIIGKQRNGPIGMVRLTFLGEFTSFENYTSAYDGGYS